METFKPNAQRARLAILFSWITLATTVICLLSSILQLDLFQSWADGAVYDEAAAEANDLHQMISGLFCSAATIAWMVLFLMWFYRARVNLQTRIGYPSPVNRDWRWVIFSSR